ncbi:MAG: hypothetical protein AAGD25_25190 [Cyanobacteria bacterium P01_F01_bin.150]
MLFDPEKKTRFNDDTIVFTDETQEAESRCRKIAEKLEERGNPVRHIGVKKRGKTHRCIQEWEAK